MSMLDGVLGGAIGAEMVTVVNGLIQKHGGVQGLISRFQQQGLGPTIQSWIGTGENKSISPSQVRQIIDPETLKQLSAQTGLSPDELAAKLVTVLPQAVDKMTPTGTAV